jgi:hypothetical protein
VHRNKENTDKGIEIIKPSLFKQNKCYYLYGELLGFFLYSI